MAPSTAEVARFTSTGLGIGTSSPNYKLVVNGSAVRIVNNSNGSAANDGILLDNTAGASPNNYLPAINWNTGTLSWATIDGFRAAGGGYGGTLRFNTMDTSGVNTERARIDSSGNVGIGTSSLTDKLTAQGTIRTTDGTNYAQFAKNFLRSYDSGTFYFDHGTVGQSFIWRTSSASSLDTTALTLSAAGNLGLGVTPFANSLSKSLDLVGGAGLWGTSNQTELTCNAYYNGGFRYKATAFAGLYQMQSGQHQWNIAPSGTIDNLITFTQAMTLDASGNLGLGVTSPAARLDTRTSTASTTAVTDVAYFYANSTGTATSTFGARIGLYTQNANGNSYPASIAAVNDAGGSALTNLAFYTYNSTLQERARIDSSGNLLVGTTSGANTRLYSVMSVSGQSAGRFYQNFAGNQSTPALIVEKVDNTTTTSQVFVQFTINAQTAGSGQINANGASQAAFGSYSDSRLKENIIDLQPQLASIMALRPVEFDYIKSEGGGHQTGFIAQEMETIFPDAIGERADGMKTVTGWNKTEAILVKALQEAVGEINQLKARLDAANL